MTSCSPLSGSSQPSTAGLAAISTRLPGTLNEYGIAPTTRYPAKELREAAADLAALKYEVLKKVGDAVGNTQAY